MQQVTQKTAANAEESASASEEMSAQAESMQEFIGELQDVVGSDSRAAAPVARGGKLKPPPKAPVPLRPGTAPASGKRAAAEAFPLEGDFQEF